MKKIFIDNQLVQKLQHKKRRIRTKSRSSVVVKSMLRRRIFVYNGRSFRYLRIRRDMLGFKLGSFVHTVKMGKLIHLTKKNLKKKKRRK